MQCYNCGYKLPNEDAKECPLCGMRFPISCHSCNSPNPLMAKFCMNCGNELKNEAMQSSIHNFQTLQESRKNVAVMFADVSGFTSLSEKMDPEEVRELINDVFNYITEPVYKLEGTIDKYIGDCVMILFGAKYPHSDDPKRAVSCGLEMLELIEKFSKERLANKGIELELSIGINYGLVVTGSVGNYFDKDYTVMGDVVNTAQRLQTVAGKGNILVSEAVYYETKDEVLYSQAKNIFVKNKEKSVLAYNPVELKESSKKDYLSLISRDAEIEYMKDIYDTHQSTHFLLVVGEGGVGKTSLVKGFINLYQENVKQVWVTCNPIYQNRVNYVISSILLNLLNLKIEDSQRIKSNRLKSYIDFILKDSDIIEEDIERNYNFISLIMGLERDYDFQKILNAMEYEDLQREINVQLAIFFAYTLKKNEVMFVIDDLQWADSGSVNILLELFKHLEELKSLFIFTSRYKIEEIPVDSEKGNILELKPLDQNGISSLAVRLLSVMGLEEKLLDATMKYTLGNPLYIKEFISSLERNNKIKIKKGMAYLRDENAMSDTPRNIESLILANISELDDQSIHLLQLASIIGKEFNLSWLNRLLDFNVDEQMLKLPVQINIISLKDIYTLSGMVEKIYSFNQDIIREVIYNSILIKTKQHYHKKIAEMIEDKYKNELGNYYEILSLHYKLAGLNNKAQEYYYKSAIKYKDNFNYLSAINYYNNFIELEEAGQHRTESKYVQAIISLADIYTIISEYDKALEKLERALLVSESNDNIHTINMMRANVFKEKGLYKEALSIIDDLESILRQNSNNHGKLLQLKCTILSITRDRNALEVAKKSEEILLKTKDYENLAETLSQAGIIYFSMGDVDNALYYFNKAHQYIELIDNLRLDMRVSGNMGIIYHSTGMTSKALEFFKKAISIAKKISNTQSYLIGNINLGILYMDKGLFQKSEALFQEALKLSRDISSKLNESIVLTNLGDLAFEQGNKDIAVNYYNQSLAIATKHGLPITEGINYLGIAKTDLISNRYAEIPNLLNKAYSLFKKASEQSYISEYYMYQSLFEFQKGNTEAAYDYCLNAIDTAEMAGNDTKKLKALRLLGEILVEKGEYQDAIKYYEQSIHLAVQLESDYEAAIGYYKKYLALVKTQSLEAAKEALTKAKNLIHKVDNNRYTALIDHL